MILWIGVGNYSFADGRFLNGLDRLRCQVIGIGARARCHLACRGRFNPTEAVAMLSSVLRSSRAVGVNVEIMPALVYPPAGWRSP